MEIEYLAALKSLRNLTIFFYYYYQETNDILYYTWSEKTPNLYCNIVFMNNRSTSLSQIRPKLKQVKWLCLLGSI